MRPQVLIDASNLHSGGGVQVAASFLNELFTLGEDSPAWLADAAVLASRAVSANLEAGARSAVQTVDARPGAAFLLAARPSYDVVFTIFGPTYKRRVGFVEIAGFADPTVPSDGSGQWRLRKSVKRWIKRARIRSVDHVVVETHAFAEEAARLGVNPGRISIIPNACATAVRTSVGPSRSRIAPEADLVLLYPARPYPHKNHRFLGPVRRKLRESHGLDVRFVVTLTEAELAAFGPEVTAACVCVGVVPVDQLAALYECVDGVFFPSLLEVFSATPLEALAIGVPLFASDRDFVRELIGDAAVYFDPSDPTSAAQAILAGLSDVDATAARVRRGIEIVEAMPTARDRALKYVELIGAHLSERGS